MDKGGTGIATRRDPVLGSAAVVLGVLALALLRDVPIFDRNGPGPALAPGAVAVALAVCGAVLATRGAAGTVASEEARTASIAPVAATLAALVASAAALEPLGLALTALGLAGVSARLLYGVPWPRALAFAVAAAILTQIAAGAAGLPAPILPLVGGPGGLVR